MRVWQAGKEAERRVLRVKGWGKGEKYALKIGYITLYAKFFMDKECAHQKWRYLEKKRYKKK